MIWLLLLLDAMVELVFEEVYNWVLELGKSSYDGTPTTSGELLGRCLFSRNTPPH
jgi:hypothetical protein